MKKTGLLLLLMFLISCTPQATPSSVNDAISRAILFLDDDQMDYGEFKSYVCSDALMRKCNFDSSPFVTTLILYSIRNVKDEEVAGMVNKAVDFLLSEQEGGVWRYWTSRNNKHIAPDLDDTSTASFILQLNNVTFEDNRQIIQNNKNEDGLFYTWIQDEQNDIDCIVNTNVLLYLGQNDPVVCSYLNRAMLANILCSHYYTSRLSQIYMYSRAYENNITCLGEHKGKIIEEVLRFQRNDGTFGDDLHTALALNALQNYGYAGKEVHTGITLLLSKQNKDGSWDSSIFYKGPKDCTDNCLYWQSPALTTALAVESLKKYSSSLQT